jgi:Domain of unknown function (DUF222)/HNH endonuclease
VVQHLGLVADPDAADGQAERQHEQRRLWVSPTWDGMVAVDGQLEAEAGQIVLAALEPLARPTGAEDDRSGSQRNADALAELARRQLEAGRLPQGGGVRPPLLVTVDLDSLLVRHAGVGGEIGGLGPLDPEACRRLACDSAVTRVLVTRHPDGPDSHDLTRHPDHDPGPSGPGHPDKHGQDAPDHDPGPGGPGHPDKHGQDALGPDPGASDHHHHPGSGGAGGLVARLRAAAALLPPALGGAPSQPLEVGRTSRVVTPAQRAALLVRDGGCAIPGCQRPPAWCEAHHLRHWLHGGPTDLANLALVCRAHHRAVHEGGWQLVRQADGRLTATPPHRRHQRHRPAA